MDANLLVTFDPAHTGSAKEEATKLLEEAGEKPEFLESKIGGLFLIKVGDAKKAVKSLPRDKAKYKFTFHWSGVDKWCKSDIAGMQKVIKGLAEGIGKEEKWKMDLSKRQFDTPKDIIVKLTDPIERENVDLKDPDKIVKVDIIGKNTAIALLNKDEYLDTQKI